MAWNQHTGAITPERRAKALGRARRVRELRKRCGSYHERIDFAPLTPGACDFCGARIARGRRFCPGGGCAAAHRDLAKHRGAMLYDLLYRWRARRHVKGGTAGLLPQIARRIDAFISEDRELRERLNDDDDGKHGLRPAAGDPANEHAAGGDADRDAAA